MYAKRPWRILSVSLITPTPWVGLISHRVGPEPAIGPAGDRTRWAGPMINSAESAAPNTGGGGLRHRIALRKGK